MQRKKVEIQKEKEKDDGNEAEGGYHDKPKQHKPPTWSSGVKCNVCGKWVKDEAGLAMHQRSSVRCASRRGEDSPFPPPSVASTLAGPVLSGAALGEWVPC